MDQLPPDFAESLARVVEPGHQTAVAAVVKAATRLDDDELRVFLTKFAARIRSSPALLKRDELFQLLQASKKGEPSTGP